MTAELRLCETDFIEEGEALRVEVEGHAPFAVYHDGEGFHVSDDLCSHGAASLADGTLSDGRIECPWHSGSFCLKTGQALTFPAVEPIRVYPATVRDGWVFIEKPEAG